MGQIRCINPKSPKVITLAEKLGYSPARTAGEIEVWQEKNNKGLAQIPTMEEMGMNFIPWKTNTELYKKYNLLNVEGSIKGLSESAAKKWAATNNGSPYYYFEARMNASKKWVISIAKRLWTKGINDEQLPLFEAKLRQGVKLTLTENTNSVAYLTKVAESNHKLAPLAKKLLEKGYAIPILVVDGDDKLPIGLTLNERGAAGMFDPNINKIYLNKGVGLKYGEEHTIIHEILHAMSYDILRSDVSAAKKFKKLYEHVSKQEVSDEYAVTNIDEFLVAIFTNPNLALDLSERPPVNAYFANAWEEILDFFRTLLRIEKKNSTLFEQAFAAGTQIIEAYNFKVSAERDLASLPDEAFFDEAETQATIYKELTSTKIALSADEKTYTVNGEEGYRRTTDVIRKKRNLGNLDTSISQGLGDIFHAVAANRVASAFPEFNTHFTEIPLEGLEDETIRNIHAIIDPIINRAKAEGSVLITELPIASSKMKVAGTVDLLEITRDKELRMLDYKTSMMSKHASSKYKKVRGNSDQQKIYKDILEDSLGERKGRKVKYQELMYIKASAKKGIKFQVLEKIPVLYQASKNASRNKMLSNLYQQIEELVDKRNKTNADKIDRIVAAKRKLMIKLQEDVQNEEILQDAFADLAAIENILSLGGDVDLNYIDFRNDLDMYKKLTEFVKVNTEKDKRLLHEIVGRASELYQQLYDDASSKFISKAAASLSFEGSPIETEEDILKPIQDINAYQSRVLGASYSRNPVVIATYNEVQKRLAAGRNKARKLGKEITGLVDELKKFTGKAGEDIYDAFLQTNKGKKTGYIVREFKSEFYNDASQAKVNGDVAWFTDNATFDNEKYTLAKERFQEYLDMSMSSTIASKLAYIQTSEKTKNLSNEEQLELAKKYAIEDNNKALIDWTSKNKTILQYHKPKAKWKDPKWTEIKEGRYKGTVVERFYDLYVSTMEEIEDVGLPFYVSENFIPEFKKDFINRIINNGIGSMRIGEAMLDALSIEIDESEFNKIDPFTGKFIRNIPVLGRKSFKTTEERERFVSSEKSYDLGYSLSVFYESAVRHQELKAIETTFQVARAILDEQKEKLSSSTGEDIIGGFDQVKIAKGLDEEIKRFEYFIDSTVYGKTRGKETGFKFTGNGVTQALGILPKGSEKVISHSRLLDVILKYTGLNNIGYNLYSPITNMLGGKSMQLLMGIGGRWYDTKDYNFASLVVSAGPFSNINPDTIKANKFVEMLNPQINEFVKSEFDNTKSEYKALHNVPGPFSFMRWTEDHMHKAGLIAMIKSNKHSVKWDDWKVVGDELQYVGEGEMDEGIKEMFRQKVIHVNGRALGNMNPDDKIMIKKWFLGRAIMQHRGWIPAMLQSHWSSRKYDYQLQDYVEGRFNSLFTFITSKSLNWNKLDDIEKAGVKEALAETGIILGAMLLLAALKGGDDDEERRKRLAYFIRVGDRYLAEMTFFTPFEISGKGQILISPAPAVSSIQNFGRFVNNFGLMLYGTEEEAKKADKKLTKSAKRLVPFYSQADRFINEVFQQELDANR